MAPSAMGKYLAAAAKQLRERADRRLYQVASSSTDRLDPSTLHRFEKGRWPENSDRVIDLYAEDLGIEAIEIWALAVELWRAEEANPGEEVDELIGEIESEQTQAQGDPPHGRAGGRSAAGARARAKRSAGARRTR